MDDATYNRKVEQAKEQANRIEDITTSYQSSSPKTPGKERSKHVDDSENQSDYWSSVQCAQRQRSYTDQNSKKEIVNLVTPEATKKSYPSLSFSSGNKPHDYSKVLIEGRNLFPNDCDDDDEHEVTITKTTMGFLERTNIQSEVKILGESNFTNKCNIMCNQADEVYNTSLCLGSPSSSTSKENFVPRRIINASRYICSPYDGTETTVKPIEIKHWEAITTLCGIDEVKFEWAIQFDNCRVSVLQLGLSMKMNRWVQSYVINVVCRKMFRDQYPRISKKHFFFSTTSDYFLEKWKNEETRERWKVNVIKGLNLANGAHPLHLSERLYFPSVYVDYWIVFAVDIKARNFLFLDSLLGPESATSQRSSELLIKNFKAAWSDAGLRNLHFEKFGKVYPNVPKQNNGDDCGIFAIKFLEYCPRNPTSCRFTWNDIPQIRIKLANELQFVKYNEKKESILRVQNFEPKLYEE